MTTEVPIVDETDPTAKPGPLSGQVRRWLAAMVVVVGTLLLAYPVSAAAEGGHEEGWGFWDPVGRWFNLLLLAGVLFFLLRGRLKKFFVDRGATIREDIQKANEDYQKALAELHQAEERIRNLDDDLTKMRRQAQEEAEAERRRVLEQAERDAERVIESARREIEGLTRNARKELREYAAELAVGMAETEIRTQITRDDQKRAAERFVIELGTPTKE